MVGRFCFIRFSLQVALDHIAVTIQAVVDNCKQLVTDDNEALFLEMLVDLIREMDNFAV